MTINPLEANEVTLPLPDSPKNAEATTSRSSIGDRVDNHSSIGRSHSSRSKKSYGHKSIANTTIIVDDDGNEVVKEDMDANERMLSVDSAGNGEDDEFRRYHYINVPSKRDDSLKRSLRSTNTLITNHFSIAGVLLDPLHLFKREKIMEIMSIQEKLVLIIWIGWG